MGQAVNAMYPDISLWPFILVTMGFSPVHQIVIIKLLIVILTLIVSYLTLCRHNIPSDISLYSAIVLVLFIINIGNTGIIGMFAPGGAIIDMFVLPIAFTINDILSSQHINKKLAVKFSLILILIIYSHLISIVILGFIMLGMMVVNVIFGRFNIFAIINVLIGGGLALLGGLPIIYRYLLFNSSGITMPYLCKQSLLIRIDKKASKAESF